MGKSKCVAIIPARGGSKGIPNKNLIHLCGKPLIYYTVNAAVKSNLIDRVIVSTNDSKISEVSKRYGAEVIIRPEKLAKDTSPTEPAIIHAIDSVESLGKSNIDTVVMLQLTSPIRSSNDIDNAIRTFKKDKVDSLFSASIMESFSIWNKHRNKLRSVTYDYKDRRRRQDRNPFFLENGSIYVFKPDILRKYNNRLGGKIGVYLMESWKSHEIDSAEDIEICEYFIKKLKLNRRI